MCCVKLSHPGGNLRRRTKMALSLFLSVSGHGEVMKFLWELSGHGMPDFDWSPCIQLQINEVISEKPKNMSQVTPSPTQSCIDDIEKCQYRMQNLKS